MYGCLLICVAMLMIGSVTSELTADGLEFTYNQKNFKIKTFKMYGMEFNDTSGYTSASMLPLDNRGYNTVQENCDFEKDAIPFHKYSKASTLIYYPSSSHYDDFEGYDLVPENKDNYYSGTPFAALNKEDGKKYVNKEIKMHTCRVPQDDGGAWHVQRVGPLISRGGYDWWQVAWDNLGMLDEIFAKHPKGIDMTKFIISPVKKDGTRLGYPPIHIHHIHGIPQPGVKYRMKMIPVCPTKTGWGISSLDNMVNAFGNFDCYNSSLYIEQHGDYQCHPEDDGIECLTQGDHLMRRLPHPIDLEGELNDVRPANSEPLEWYFQLAIKWRPIDYTEQPSSLWITVGPPYILPPSQLTSSMTYPVPTDEETVSMYQAEINMNCELIRLKMHAHAIVYQSSMLLSGKYEDFGLDDPKYISSNSYEPRRTRTELHFEDNEAVALHILAHMKKSQDKYDKHCGHGKKKSSSFRDGICSRPRPDWICGAVVDFEEVEFGGEMYKFDRRPKTWCKPWSMKKGDPYIAIGFNKKVDSPPSPVHPGSIPKFANQHLGIGLYVRIPGQPYSIMNSGIITHEGAIADFYSGLTPTQVVSRMISVALYNGFPNHSATLDTIGYIFLVVFTTLVALSIYGCISCCGKKQPPSKSKHAYSPLKTADVDDHHL
mmetsp:Transcript_4367/g.7164  ORF Transcript_4367/g.7164 Transcript_4367/m.7164 type:complete len:656 (+) Transcript_4367:183-2150(+)